MNKKSHEGTSLIEVLIATLILTTITSLAYSSYSETLVKNQHQALRDGIFYAIENARTKAINSNITVIICASNDATNCTNNWSNGWIVKTPINGKILHSTQHVNKHDVRWSGYTNQIRFQRNGSSPSSNGRIYQCRNKEVSWQLILNRQGRLRQGTPTENRTKAGMCTG